MIQYPVGNFRLAVTGFNHSLTQSTGQVSPGCTVPVLFWAERLTSSPSDARWAYNRRLRPCESCGLVAWKLSSAREVPSRVTAHSFEPLVDSAAAAHQQKRVRQAYLRDQNGAIEQARTAGPQPG